MKDLKIVALCDLFKRQCKMSPLSLREIQEPLASPIPKPPMQLFVRGGRVKWSLRAKMRPRRRRHSRLSNSSTLAWPGRFC